MQRIFFTLVGFIIYASVAAQLPDSLFPSGPDSVTVENIQVIDTIPVVDSSVSERPWQYIKPWQIDLGKPFVQQVLANHPYFNFTAIPASPSSNIKVFKGKELFFYVFVSLLLLFALFKLAFAKYFNDLFRVFFQTTIKQRQIREQLMQSPMPSLAFNIFFVLTTALYLTFLAEYLDRMPDDNFWITYLYCMAGLSVIYVIKYAGLKICGWLFSIPKAADSYIFIVFIINKIIGIFLLPVVIILGTTSEDVQQIVWVLSWCGIGGLLCYRFILGFATIRNEVRFNIFHFFLYLCAFEVAPLLLIYKLLVLAF